MRGVVFVLAFLSFACLLGHFYGLWTMRFFGCWVLPPATAFLAFIAYRNRRGGAYTWIVHGAIAGLVAAVVYDLYRLPFVLSGAPLFKVFPRFGELLLGSNEPRWLIHGVGWGYHFSNGAALGIMFLAIATAFPRANLFWGAVAWALFVEVMLLLTPYANFFGLKMDSTFLLLTLSAHLVFGITLGLYCKAKARRWKICRPEHNHQIV
jgi:hypothetical protein